MLEDLTIDSFAPVVGDDFTLDAGDAGTLVLRLTGATPLDDRAAPRSDFPGRRRTPFSLLFEGPPESMLVQRTHRLAHTDLGELDIFLVPVGRVPDALLYEAVFT